MKCQKCKSKRILSIVANSKNSNSIKFHNQNINLEDVYLPEIDNVCNDDDVAIDVCLDCGQLQGTWPVDDDEEYIENNKDIAEDDEEQLTHDFDNSLFDCSDSVESKARYIFFEERYEEYIKSFSKNEAIKKAEDDLKKEVS